MRSKKLSLRFSVAIAMFALASLLLATQAAAQTEKILHSFSSTGTGGLAPSAGLIFDGSGNLYSTTPYGSTYNDGTVFELLPASGGGWVEKAIHVFGSSTKDGTGSFAAVIFDAAGNLYGVAASGGQYGYGDVFELVPKTTGAWEEKILHSFNQNSIDGTYPFAGLILDAAGNLYGTTVQGGNSGKGIVFELSPTVSGPWTETIVHQFGSISGDGSAPEGTLIMDASGNLYGTTTLGGAKNDGIVFELSPTGGGSWMETILHTFGEGSDGQLPQAGLIMDASGNLYGTTSYGGDHNNSGTVFEVSPTGGGAWTEAVLHNFGNSSDDGVDPVDSLIFDSTGNLYGTTSAGGAYGFGTVFKLSPRTGGGWTEARLHMFGNGLDGQTPAGNLIFDASGNLYGTTVGGGVNDDGTVFEITP